MTKEEIIEGNRLLAEFMGLKEDPISIEVDKERAAKGLYVGEPTYMISDNETTNLQYNFSWDWLMLVVEKIEKDKHPVYICSNKCTIYEYADKNIGFIIDKYANSKIEAVWLAVIDFIKWYNKQL